MCFDVDGEEPAVFSRVERRARMEHACWECRVAIARGTAYEYTFGVWDGTPQSFKTCPACVALRQRVHDHEIAEGCAWYEAVPEIGRLWEGALEIGVVTAAECPAWVREAADGG